MKKVFHNIQGLRGIAVLVVILFHLFSIEKKYSADQLLPAVLQLGSVGVDLFFLISGFIMMTVTRPLPPGTGSMRQFLLQRCIRIYPLYWLVSALIIAGLLIRPDLVKAIPESPHYIALSLLLLPQENLPLLSVGWTLIHEMYFYAVFCVLLLVPTRLHAGLLATWSALAMTGWFVWQPAQEQPWPYLLCNPLTLEFTAGCFLAMLLQRWQPARPGVLVASGTAAMFGSWVYWRAGNDGEFPLEGMRVACFLLPCALILAGTVALEKQGRIFASALRKIGDASYALYLLHILILSAGGRVWQVFGDAGSPTDNLLWLPLLFALTLLGGMLCHRWIEKPLLGMLRKWLRADPGNGQQRT